MRLVIVDLARGAMRAKPGSGVNPVSLSTLISESTSAGEEQVLRVHEALANAEWELENIKCFRSAQMLGQQDCEKRPRRRLRAS